MTTALPKLEKLKPNPNWAKLPLFNRKNWTHLRFPARSPRPWLGFCAGIAGRSFWEFSLSAADSALSRNA
jgi:hypothetical protein